MLDTALTYIDHRQLTLDPDFRHRKVAENATHLAGLRKTLKNIGNLDAILVWREQDDEGCETGRLVLLDGYFRVTAYRAEIAAGHIQGKGIPALIGKGNRASPPP